MGVSERVGGAETSLMVSGDDGGRSVKVSGMSECPLRV